MIDTHTVSSEGKIQPTIRGSRGCTPTAAPACRLISVRARVERRMIVDIVTGRPLRAYKLGRF